MNAMKERMFSAWAVSLGTLLLFKWFGPWFAWGYMAFFGLYALVLAIYCAGLERGSSRAGDESEET